MRVKLKDMNINDDYQGEDMNNTMITKVYKSSDLKGRILYLALNQLTLNHCFGFCIYPCNDDLKRIGAKF